MKRVLSALLMLAAVSGAAGAEPTAPVMARLDGAIKHNLGRPYVLGSAGNKSYDCSGFVWRVLTEAGVFIKRSSARKYYFAMPKVTAEGDEPDYRFGQLVFFDDLRHVGIVENRDNFFHAQTGQGTRRSAFEPYWRSKVMGFRAIPLTAAPDGAALAQRDN